MAKEPKPRKEDSEQYDAVMRMRIVDDTFFEVFFNDPGVCEELLQTVFDNPKLRIKRSTFSLQKSVRFVANRSIRVDAYVEDDEQVIYNIEIQHSDNCHHTKRVRYNASALTVRGSEPGDLFDNVRNVIVIYISEFDIFGLGLPIYHAYTTIKETNTVIDDGLEMIYVNTEAKADTKLTRLMRRYKEPDFEDSEFPEHSARMYQIKHDEKEVTHMCNIVRELEEKAKAKAALENSLETAKKLLALKKNSIEEIAECTNLPLEEVRELAEVTK